MTIPLTLLAFCIVSVFSIGGAWAMLQQIKKDLNGIGAKFAKFKDHDNRMVITLLVLTEKRTDRETIARNLMEW